jgi:hypothetical protein
METTSARTSHKQLITSPSYSLNTLEFMHSTYKNFLTSNPISHNKTFHTKEVLLTTISSFKPRIIVHIILGDLYHNIYDHDPFHEILLKLGKKVGGKIYTVYDLNFQNTNDKETPEGYFIKDISEFFSEFDDEEIDFILVDYRDEMNDTMMKHAEFFKINYYTSKKLCYKCVFMINDCYGLESNSCKLLSVLMQTHHWTQLESRCKCLFIKGFS